MDRPLVFVQKKQLSRDQHDFRVGIQLLVGSPDVQMIPHRTGPSDLSPSCSSYEAPRRRIHCGRRLACILHQQTSFCSRNGTLLRVSGALRSLQSTGTQTPEAICGVICGYLWKVSVWIITLIRVFPMHQHFARISQNEKFPEAQTNVPPLRAARGSRGSQTKNRFADVSDASFAARRVTSDDGSNMHAEDACHTCKQGATRGGSYGQLLNHYYDGRCIWGLASSARFPPPTFTFCRRSSPGASGLRPDGTYVLSRPDLIMVNRSGNGNSQRQPLEVEISQETRGGRCLITFPT